MIYVVYNNDPLGSDQGGGAEHARGLFRALKSSDLPFTFLASRMQNERSDPRVVYLSQGAHFGRFYLALWLWFLRNRLAGDDVVHVHRNYCAWPKYLLSPSRGRVVITYHCLTGKVLELWLGPLGRLIHQGLKRLEHRAVARADRLIFVSGRDKQAMMEEVAAASLKRAMVIPAAFDSRLFGPSEPPDADRARSLLVLARLEPVKNVPLAIDTFEWLADRDTRWRLTIAGDGGARPAIEARIVASPHKRRIRLTGLVAHDRVPDLIEEHGIVLVTSRSEASPTVVKEGLALGRMIVTTDVGDVSAWIDHGRTGFITDSAEALDLAALAEAAARLIEQGQAASVSLPDEAQIMDRVLQVYRSLDERVSWPQAA
ncbi:MAG: glycosyltransferase family 4 protein [Geminicoccaceae bacterium]